MWISLGVQEYVQYFWHIGKYDAFSLLPLLYSKYGGGWFYIRLNWNTKRDFSYPFFYKTKYVHMTYKSLISVRNLTNLMIFHAKYGYSKMLFYIWVHWITLKVKFRLFTWCQVNFGYNFGSCLNKKKKSDTSKFNMAYLNIYSDIKTYISSH